MEKKMLFYLSNFDPQQFNLQRMLVKSKLKKLRSQRHAFVFYQIVKAVLKF